MLGPPAFVLGLVSYLPCLPCFLCCYMESRQTEQLRNPFVG